LLARVFNRAKQAATQTVHTVMQVANLSLHIRSANSWRDAYNPLRGLDMRRAVALLEAGERGAYAELQWTYRFIEKRDATLRGGKRSLVAAVGGMDWEIRAVDDEKLPPGATKTMAKRQRDTLRTAYDRIDNLRAAIEHFCLAEFRGYAHLEKCYAAGGANDGAITHLEPIEQWYLVRQGLCGEWQYNRDARFGAIRGEEIPPGVVMTREVEDPINEIALIAFVRKNLSQKDWDGFIESYGIPSIFAVMPQQVPAGQESAYLAVAEQVIGNARGVLPSGADIKTVDNGARGVNPFREHLRYQDEQIAIAITSGLLTMLAESGSGTLAGGAHSETFERIARGLAGRISESFQRQFDAEILAEFHPGEPVLAYFSIAAEEEGDTGEFIVAVKDLAQAGYQVSPGQIAEKTGYDVEVKQSSVPGVQEDPAAELKTEPPKDEEAGGALKNRKSKIENPKSLDAALEAIFAELAAVAEPVLADELAKAAVKGAPGSAVLEGVKSEIGNKKP
jgi:phage gp29-like protein